MRQILGILMLLAFPAAAAERYIVPVWGQNVQGATGTYFGAIALTNLGYQTATVNVTNIMPVAAHVCLTAACGNLVLSSTFVTVPRYGTRVISDIGAIFFRGAELQLGAVELESDQPIDVAAEIFKGRVFAPVSWQTVEVARDWITGRAMIPRGLPGNEPFRLYLINPNDFPISVAYSSEFGGHGSTDVPPRRTVVVDLENFFCPTGCGGAEQPTGYAAPLFVESSGPYLAASVTTWRGVAPTVRIARPVTIQPVP